MRKTIVGIVVSDKMDKSIVVEVKTLVKDPKYGKQLRKTTKFKACLLYTSPSPRDS